MAPRSIWINYLDKYNTILGAQITEIISKKGCAVDLEATLI